MCHAIETQQYTGVYQEGRIRTSCRKQGHCWIDITVYTLNSYINKDLSITTTATCHNQDIHRGITAEDIPSYPTWIVSGNNLIAIIIQALLMII